ncbi:hypothetical protein ICW40_15490, partial [Actinotalea ferrariae]|nr:hypothetical protein [Actinotalea ferrariae]
AALARAWAARRADEEPPVADDLDRVAMRVLDAAAVMFGADHAGDAPA